TLFNWGRATLGVIPFVLVGKAYGAEGILIGWGLGAIVFGIGAVVVAFYVIKNLPMRERQSRVEKRPVPPAANSPFTSGKGAGFSVGGEQD
ncbi:MAG: MATE family efflux transporter, partial [Pseudomonadota bacterium]